MKETCERLSRIFFQFSPSSSSIVSRRIWSPRPALSLPFRSTMTTSPDFRRSMCMVPMLARHGAAEGLGVPLYGDALARLLHVGAEELVPALLAQGGDER